MRGYLRLFQRIVAATPIPIAIARTVTPITHIETPCAERTVMVIEWVALLPATSLTVNVTM